MKRLIDDSVGDRLGARAQELVRAMGGPTPESPERSQRVRRSLDAPVRGAPRWVWRLSLAVGLLGVSAAAAAGGTALSRAFSDEQAVPVVSAPAERPAPRPRPPTARVERAPSVSAPPTAVATPSAQAPAAAAPRPQLAAPASEVSRVHEAAKALRHEGDPERALQLLERSGARISGPLAEEALALRIEASVAKGDGRQAKLAASYLAQYPNGRYRELAKKALAGRQQ
ncbi:MAG TPA: hypothetical protein VHP33_01860 [Polyangiaceae bacterium]|nr:hypothetical protein [Polyangiaceae bacterium]